MNEVNLVNSTIKTIFTEPKLNEVLCSLYDNELKPVEISSLLSIELHIVNIYLLQLYNAGLVIKKIRDGEEHYTLSNTKVCDALLMLKDELFKTLRIKD